MCSLVRMSVVDGIEATEFVNQSPLYRAHLGHAHTIQRSPLTLYCGKLPSCHFRLITKNRTMSKSCYVARCTANKQKKTQIYVFISCRHKKGAFKDTNSCWGISRWAIQLNNFSNIRKVRQKSTDIDQ